MMKVEVLERLTDKQKEVMILYYREGYTQAEIAEMLGIGRRTVSDRIEAALKRIRKEERVDYSHIAPSGFGTADMLIIGKDEQGRGLLHVCDFKTGAGVFVDADHNSQMMLYALGGLAAYGFLYDVEIVRMSIIQPRLDNISTCEMPVSELNAWAESIKPIAIMAYEGKGEQHPGDWCRFCRATH